MRTAINKKLTAFLVVAVVGLALFLPGQALADPFIGEIKMFAGNFAPRGWAFCDGQLLTIAQNTALFSILGTTYGGDGRTTFGLPDLRSRVAIHEGTGPGLSNYRLGQRSGAERTTLTQSQMPSHSHGATATAAADSGPGSQAGPAGGVPAAGRNFYSPVADADTTVPASVTVANTGGGQSHTNIQPYTTVNYIICLTGLFPPQ